MKKIYAFCTLFIYMHCFALSPPAPLYKDLGDLHEAVSTKSELAQQYVDQGLLFFYGFDYAESIRSFEGAITSDPNCATCYALAALALGSKTNTPIIGNERIKARKYLSEASKHAKVEEKPFINALKLRYKAQDNDPGLKNKKLVTPHEKHAFSHALKRLVDKQPNNTFLLGIYVYALFDEADWNFYDKTHKPYQITKQMLTYINRLFELNPNHPNGLHIFIHATELSGDPWQAEVIADNLAKHYTHLEHLAHMPSHIYLMTNRIHDATEQNLLATAAHERYVHNTIAQGFKPVTNFLAQHNYHFLWTAASWEGRYALADYAAKKLSQLTPLKQAQKDESLQWFYQMEWLNEIRFGKWHAIETRSMPDPKLRYLTKIAHFAKCVAASHLNKHVAAKQHLLKMGHNFDHYANQNNLIVARKIAEASIADNHSAIPAWEAAVSAQEENGTIEPPTWLMTVKLGLAKAYIEDNRHEEALAVIDSFLQRFPNQLWLLKEKETVLTKLGKTQEAREIHDAFIYASRFSDSVI